MTAIDKIKNIVKNDPDHQNVIYAGIAALVAIACLLRLALIKFQTLDYGVFSQWYDFLKLHGFHAFKYGFSNYTAPYNFVLYIFSSLPISKIHAIKGSMIIFDFVLAYAVYLVVKLMRGNKNKYIPILAGLVTLYLPTVFINSAFWAQIDASYTSFLILSLYFCLKGKSKWAWVFFGIALAFKFQAIFFLPALVFMIFKKIKWYDAYLAVVTFLVLVFPPMLVGRPFMQILKIYVVQSKQFNGALTLNAPNFYQWLPSSAYNYFNNGGILLTFAAVIFAILVGLIYKKYSNRELLVFSSLLLFVIPFLLPQMHERYFYPAEISALLVAFTYPAYAWIAVLMQLITFFAYWPFLFGREPVSFTLLAFGVLVIICALSVLYMRAGRTEDKEPKRPLSVPKSSKSINVNEFTRR